MKLLRMTLLSLSVPMISIAVAACGSASAPPPQTALATTPVSDPAPPVPASETSLNVGGESATTPGSHSMSQAQQGQATPPSGAATPDQSGAPAALNDDEIAAIIAASNTGEVEQARLAQSKAKDARVKKFATHMITDHTESGQKETQVMTKAGLKSEDSPVSIQLTSDSTKLVDSLKGQTGTEFDRMYIDAQVKQHQQLLDMIDHKFLPNVKSADLKGFLQTLRPKVDTHLKEAKEIQKSLPAK